MNVTGYSYPWDYVGDPEAAHRAATLGVDVVALAASYHAARVVSPLHPTRLVTDVPYAACYTPRREEAWRDHRLSPGVPSWLDSEDSFVAAQRRLADEGLDVDAWIVLTHFDDVGNEVPELVVRNAFDEPYPYALCPRAEDVQEYCLTLVAEILQTTNLRGVVLEACGPMGFEHASTHDKSEFAQLSAVDEQLLSICFCRWCRVALRERGVDDRDLARRVRASLATNATSLDDALGDELATEVSAHRVALATTLRRALVERIRHEQPSATITLHASAQRWATGSFSPSGEGAALADVTTAVANCWNASSATAELLSLSEVARGHATLGGYLRVDRGWSDDALVNETIRRYVENGMQELHLYHLGLLSRASLATAQQLVTAFREQWTS
ncbi:MAG TPA: hypothetical protein VNF05_06385 [Acidimicrobiales bacterium]|nr:hypothetical protein [Acidimicrobiales bacterium]